MVDRYRSSPVAGWSRRTVLRRLLFVLGTTLLLVALSLAGSGSVVLATSPDPSATATVGGSTAGAETLLYVLLGIVLLVLGSVAGRRRYRRS